MSRKVQNETFFGFITQHMATSGTRNSAFYCSKTKSASTAYIVRAGKKMRDGTTNYAPPFRWLSTAEHLSMQDKFFDDTKNKPVKTHGHMKRMTQTYEVLEQKGAIGEEGVPGESKSVGYAEVVGKGKDSDSVVNKTVTASTNEEDIRPMGIKRRKLEERMAKDAVDVNESLRGIREGITEGNRLIQ
eukprot:gb/GEZJ01004512.1/.p1 GENE.gb/GEZJ01004512.1/~~gb/GEZJ01004512.1/.p1  ORF type:complete len:187 (+),score=30.71 gb/GEZJ01004512.1/:71-631(+)